MSHTILHPPTALKVSPRIRARLNSGELSQSQVSKFERFLEKVNRIFLHHRIILHNQYTHWFSQGLATDPELRHFIQQFSVFSNQFLVASLQKTINAATLEESRASREILLNELGVIYRNPKQEKGATTKNNMARPKVALNADQKDREGDPALVSTEGTVDGGICRFRAAHLEWLLTVAEDVGLSFANIGKRKHGRPRTLHFCDELIRIYGSEDPSTAEGASFAIENWAAAGFWQELEDGLTKIKQDRHPHLHLAFFSWHNRVEAQHAHHTQEELEQVFFKPGFVPHKFIHGGQDVLEALAIFWDGLNSDRLHHIYEEKEV